MVEINNIESDTSFKDEKPLKRQKRSFHEMEAADSLVDVEQNNRPYTRSQGKADNINPSIYPKEPKYIRTSNGRSSWTGRIGSKVREGYKSAFYLTEDFREQNNLSIGQIDKECSNINGHRCDTKFEGATPVKKRPIAAVTPNGTKLERISDYGFMIIFGLPSQRKEAGPIKPLTEDQKEDVLGRIKPAPVDEVKVASFTFTDKLLKNRRKKRKNEGDTRYPSQQKAAAEKGVIRAEDALLATRADLYQLGDKLAWLHLIAWMLKGKSGQVINNLVIGTKQANTDMQFAEQELPHLAEVFKGKVIKLDVKAEVIPTTHIAKKIYYNIKIDDTIIPFEFDALNRTAPKETNADYIKIVFNELVQNTLQRIKEETGVKLSIKTTSPNHPINELARTSNESKSAKSFAQRLDSSISLQKHSIA